MSQANYTPEEEAALRAGLRDAPRAADPLDCPRCGEPMDRRSVTPRAEVAYVRNRVWLVCRGCRRSAVFDRRAL